jgi:hypothetical protein
MDTRTRVLRSPLVRFVPYRTWPGRYPRKRIHGHLWAIESLLEGGATCIGID